MNPEEKYKEHLKKLKPIRENLDKFIPTKPLGIETPKPHRLEDLKAAQDAMKKWEEEHNRLSKEYTEYKHAK